jgi:P22 coat protein - gene protein 5
MAFITDTEVTKKMHSHWRIKATVTGLSDRSYDDRFARDGNKIGDTLLIRRQTIVQSISGPIFEANTVSEYTDALVVGNWTQTPILIGDVDNTLFINSIDEQVFEMGMDSHISAIEASVQSKILPYTYFNTGSLNVAPTGINQIDQADSVMFNINAPVADRFAVINTKYKEGVVQNNRTYFNPQDIVSKQYRESEVGRAATFDTYISNVLPSLTNGTATATGFTVVSYSTTTPTPTTSAVTTLLVNGGGSNNGATIKANQTFTIAGVYQIEPLSKTTQTSLQQFSVANTTTVTCDSTGGATLTVIPPIVITGPYQSVSAAPTAGEAVTFGAPSTTGSMGFACHKKGLIFATARLTEPTNAKMAKFSVVDKIGTRFWWDKDVRTSQFPFRIDTYWGFLCVPTPIYVPIVRLYT